LTDECRIHRPMSATVQIGTAIAVSPKRVRGAVEDPLMAELGRQLHDMLEIPRPQIAPIKTISEAPSVNRGAQAEDSSVEMGSLGE
jgi:hypothetical protein